MQRAIEGGATDAYADAIRLHARRSQAGIRRSSR